MLHSLSKISQSYSVSFADYVRRCELEGHQVIKMQTGDPDFATHPNVIQAAHSALLNGETKYCDSRGLLNLRHELENKLRLKNKILCSAEDNILITHGAVHGIALIIRALINSGDECIILEPFWRAYEMNVLLAGGKPVIVPTSKEACFRLDTEKVLEQITPRTKAVIINTPNNPSGAVYDRTELVKLAHLVAQRGIYIISDEVYESIVFDNIKHYSVASDPTVFDWIISVFSFSKTYAMTGWRIGYIVACESVINELLKLSQFSVTSLSPFSQAAALAALQDPDVQVYVESMRNEYQSRRGRILSAIEGSWLEGSASLPQGGFYSLINVEMLGLPSLILAKRIVESSGVAFTPGIAFGDNMDGYLRMCFATPNRNIDHAIDALLELQMPE